MKPAPLLTWCFEKVECRQESKHTLKIGKSLGVVLMYSANYATASRLLKQIGDALRRTDDSGFCVTMRRIK